MQNPWDSNVEPVRHTMLSFVRLQELFPARELPCRRDITKAKGSR